MNKIWFKPRTKTRFKVRQLGFLCPVSQCGCVRIQVEAVSSSQENCNKLETGMILPEVMKMDERVYKKISTPTPTRGGGDGVGCGCGGGGLFLYPCRVERIPR